MDSNAPCQFSTDIFENTMIPIPVCNLDAGLSLGSMELIRFSNIIFLDREILLPISLHSQIKKCLN
jgi:hypothetical protein